MPTTGFIKGTLMRFYIDDEAIGHAQECVLTLSREMTEVSTKDLTSGDYAEFVPGKISGTGSTSGLMTYDTSNKKAEDIATDLLAGTKVLARFTTDVQGDTYMQAYAYFSNLELNATDKERVTYSAGIQLTGVVTISTEA